MYRQAELAALEEEEKSLREKLAESREQAAAAQGADDSLDAYLSDMVAGERKHDQDVAKKRLKEIAAAKSKLMPLIALVSPALRKSLCVYLHAH